MFWSQRKTVRTKHKSVYDSDGSEANKSICMKASKLVIKALFELMAFNH